MLSEIVFACAPLAAVAPATYVTAGGLRVFGSRTQVQRRLYRSLLLDEKLPAATPGSAQLTASIDADTLTLAYLTQYPQRGKDIAHLGLIGLGLLSTLAVYYGALGTGAWWMGQLALLAVVVFAAAWLHRAVRNYVRTETLSRALFEHLGAPGSLHRPATELVTLTPALTVPEVLDRAADVRDRTDRPMCTVDAVNTVLASGQVPWRTLANGVATRITQVDYRAHTRTASAQTLSALSRSYDWSVQHLRGPLSTLRLQAEDAVAHGRKRIQANGVATRITQVDYRTYTKTASTPALSALSRSYDWSMQHLLVPLFTLRLQAVEAVQHGRIGRAEKAGDVYKAAWLDRHYRNERRRLAQQLSWLHAGAESVRSRSSLHYERDRTVLVG
jgi:hypothetical protein